jgi:hypothetical protein
MKKTKKPSAKSHTTKATKNLDVKPTKSDKVRGGMGWDVKANQKV